MEFSNIKNKGGNDNNFNSIIMIKNKMKLAFLIQAHKNYEQLYKLIDYLHKNDCDIYLHIDLKSELLYEKIKILEDMYKNLYLIKNRKNVVWSGFSQIDATLEMMKLADKKEYDYISLISGQDLLIKEVTKLKKYLEDNYGKEFLEYEDIGEKRWRLKKYSFFRENLNNRKIFYRLLDNLIRRLQLSIFERKNLLEYEKLYFGSQWFTLTGKAVKYILKISENKNIIKDFKYTACPDEHFFQTILLNSNFKNKCMNNNLRYIDWHDCKNSPKTLKIIDFERLNYSNYFFARKFDILIDKEVVDRIYSMIDKGEITYGE